MVSSNFYIADNSDIESKKLEAARSHYKSGDYAAALRLYLSMINSSMSYKLYHRIGKCYYKMNDLNHAKEYFQKSIELESVKNPSYLYLANLYYKDEDLKQAIYCWACAFSYKPEDESVCLNLATSYFSRGMKFQSVYYYEKYLKYAHEKGSAYSAIKTSIDRCAEIGQEFLQKAKHAISRKNNIAALEFLNFALKNLPVSYDINYLLGQIYLAENDNMHALIYLKQAYCLRPHSIEVLQKLASACINVGDYTAAYCAMKRMLPLVINDQAEYLKTMQMLKGLDSSFDSQSALAHKDWGDRYFEDNNYHFALIEYENCIMLNPEMNDILQKRIEQLKRFIHPEIAIINSCLEKGKTSLKDGDIKSSNKYFTKVMQLSEMDSAEYKLAKSKVKHV